MDGRVIDIPALPRTLLVNGIIAPFRAPKSAKVYKELWTEQGSPLKFYGVSNQKQLQKQLGEHFIVKLAMRYQSPSLDEQLLEFKTSGINELIVIPLFPQYASATSGSVYQKVMEIISKWQIIPQIKFINYFYHYPKLVEVFAQNARKMMESHQYEHFVFSYHGLPERQIRKGDDYKVCKLGECCNVITEKNQFCYRAQCFETTRLLVQALNIPEGKYTTCFQSRLGKDPWIQPYSEDTVKKLAKEGIKKVLAFSPAFVSDCLETTIEVGEEYRELFEENGGEHWHLVPSLNDNPIWIDLLEELVLENCNQIKS
jgi:ferrochelatase